SKPARFRAAFISPAARKAALIRPPPASSLSEPLPASRSSAMATLPTHPSPQSRILTPRSPRSTDTAMTAYDYIRDGAAIYERSFAIIRAEADLSRFSPGEADIAIRMIHACGQVEAARHFDFSPGFEQAARAALSAGAPILCDAEMVAHGVTRARLPAGNEVVCTLRNPRTAEIAKEIGNTRSAAALELWREKLGGALVAIGNAPTALFYLLEMLDAG